MKDSTKKMLLIGGSVVVIAGVVYYFYNQSKPSGSNNDDDTTDSDGDGIIDSEDSTPNGEPANVNTGTTPGTPPAQSLPVELNTTDKVKKFQDFMDSVGAWVKGTDGKYKKLNKGTGYGIPGPSTKAAFDVYGDLYRVYLVTSPKGKIIPIVGAGSKAAIDVLLSNGHIARYQADKKFIDFGKNYGSAENTGTWSNNGRKLVLTYGPKKGTISHSSIWDTFKTLIS
jgi:hypothetical protein